MSMTSDAKKLLSATIRMLRERLLIDLHNATESTYRLSVRVQDAALPESERIRREHLEEWIAEQVRTQAGSRHPLSAEDFRREVEKQAAYTLLNRIVILRLMEATGLRSPTVVTGGWESRGYKDFRELAPELIQGDGTEGFALLLKLVFEDLAIDLPGLYGSSGLVDLIPVPPATLLAVVEGFDNPDLASCWTDDMTLGWVYQYWNDPQREALDKKITEGGKIEPHEIASKTQMFTERYMVDWLLQNSLGPIWLAICKKHDWTPNVEADGILQRLEDRRIDWRARRDQRQEALSTEKAKQKRDPSYCFSEDKLPGVSLTEMMPLESDAERRWAYYLPQPLPNDAIEHAPDSVRDLKLLDPAVGSGHFLVVAFDLLVALYKEEAKHRGEANEEFWSDVAIVERILEHNLYGIDLDPRAVQISAAALWLKAQQTCPDAHPRQMNLVASNLGIAGLQENDPALVELHRVVEEETGISSNLTNQIVDALRGADYLGSLLKIDVAIETAISNYEEQVGWKDNVRQVDLFPNGSIKTPVHPISRQWAQSSVLSALETFLSRHTSAHELGLRLRGEQLAAGVRFVRLVRENMYDIVVGNPPYQGTSKMADATYVSKHYKLAKADLFAAFLMRGLELVRNGGVSSMLTMRSWMFNKQYSELRQYLLANFDLSALGDLSSGAFEEINAAQVVVSVAMASIWKRKRTGDEHIAVRPFSDATLLQVGETARKRAATLCHVGRHTFDPVALKIVPEWPLVYWWHNELDLYRKFPVLGAVAPARATQGLYNNVRFIRDAHEVHLKTIRRSPSSCEAIPAWVPVTNGANGAVWVEPLRIIARWGASGMEPKLHMSRKIKSDVYRYANEQFFFQPGGVAFAGIGSTFNARASKYAGIFANMGKSLFSPSPASTLCLLNSTTARGIAQALNPGVHFEAGDVNRLPLFNISHAEHIFSKVNSAITVHESHREASVEFQKPGPSPWRYAQTWAQRAVDRPEEAPLPEYTEELDPEPVTDHVSFAVGVALGRFGPRGEGILDPGVDRLSHSLPYGILFLDGTLMHSDHRDSLGHDAANIIHHAWSEQGRQIDPRRSVRDWLRERFFAHVHKGMYENRPIHWPLSSSIKTFVAWVTIHRWNDQTLRVLLADHLQPALKRLDGELEDLSNVRGSGDKKSVRAAEERFEVVNAWRDELVEFITNVQQSAERGPAPPDPKNPEREVDARYIPKLDDGVMINSAPLWPLLEPQWKDPKKWWKELATANGKKDYDWSHMAMHYWPTRVDAKCQADPSLAVAHGCFWKYHPARAWAWELRLQNEIEPSFRIEEASYRGDGGDAAHRTAFLRDRPRDALAAVGKEMFRRHRQQQQAQAELRILEPGLWSAVPELCWELEMELILKQEADFKLRAPDEPEARKTFEDENSLRVNLGKHRLASLHLCQTAIYDDASEDGEALADNEGSEQDEEVEE